MSGVREENAGYIPTVDLRIEVLFAVHGSKLDALFTAFSMRHDNGTVSTIVHWFSENAPSINPGDAYKTWEKR